MENNVPALDLHLSPFNLTHTKEGSHKLGYLYPVMFLECVPNDRFEIRHEQFSRFSPLVYPIESQINVKFYDFWVPQRILFKYWKQFIADSKLDEHIDKYPTPKIRVCDLVAPLIETVVVGEETLVGYKASKYFGPGSLLDWLGFPMAQFFSGATFMDSSQNVYYINDGLTLSLVTEEIDIMPLLAYQFIKNRWFRDENLEDDLFSEDENIGYKYGESDDVVNLRDTYINYKDGLIGQPRTDHDIAAMKQLTLLQPKLWERDYFTSALPTPQFGEPVPVPVSDNLSYKSGLSDVDGTKVVITQSGNIPPIGIDYFPYSLSDVSVNSEGNLVAQFIDEQGIDREAYISFDSSQTYDLGSLNFTINDLRQASAVQRYQETLMRIGHRYDEYILGVFNQVVPDSYLSEPLLLNTESKPVQITDIAQTTPSEQTPLGSLAGNAYSSTNTDTLYYHCEEFGFIITIATMLPRTQYMNGLPKYFSRKNRLDYYNPLFQEIGDQSILNKEIFLSTSQNDDTFGYIPRFDEYKQTFNTVHGDYTGNMSFMSLGRNFSKLPYLNKSFLTVDQTTVNRAFAETSDIDHVYSVFKNQVLAVRPMLENPLPKLV